MKEKILRTLSECCIVKSIRDLDDLPLALNTSNEFIFLQTGSLSTVVEVTNAAKKHGKYVILHFDLIDGISKDVHGLQWLVENAKMDAISTTRTSLIRNIKSYGILAAQQMFLLDNHSITTGLNLVEKCKPDFMVVMPGLMPTVIEKITSSLKCPLIVGGLINEYSQAISALDAGATAVATSEKKLWEYDFKQQYAY
ncbi:glycerol-3-phosphate responsive antiterminator [Ureibacillus acetophenoni]|uniref:Glycerol uptake operon antiterminator regulatory protein n=1 Tax=Ureibacillus acetophenoni TaxID=614649 RepID=A0A285UE40_9BACL|nr:glycerol-3-phosphate responsive antiterminator [Ureibacillus acetophenoni]SOC38561.1 glycerol uptake operon antiterminator [Ureibacillus acetophenoni]